ncbi:MAG: hypothetical protein EXR71_08165 [Myxococcales bacterium]|nr:hypothetical protein [Myxococcales bacterium]
MRLVLLLLVGCPAVDDTADVATDSGETGATNTAPVVTFVEPSGVEYAAGADIPFDAQLADAEDDPSKLDVSWTGADGTVYAIDNTPVPAGHLEGTLVLPEGEYTITLAAVDPAGNVGSASVSFTVITPNELPECAILTPSDGDLLREGESLLLAGDATDLETASGDIKVVWRSSEDGRLGESVALPDGTVSLYVDRLSVGEHEVSLTVTDGQNGECEAIIGLRVNGTPDVSVDTPHKDDVFNEGEAIAFTGSVDDDLQSPTELGITWYDKVDDVVFNTGGANASGDVSASFSGLSPGEHTVYLAAKDDDGSTGWDGVDIVINDLPPAPGVLITGSTDDDDLVATIAVESVDLEGDAITYAYGWTVNGVPFPTTDATISAVSTTPGDTWEVTITPNDGYGDGDAANASVTLP